MATSAWRSYLTRSMEHLRDRTTEGALVEFGVLQFAKRRHLATVLRAQPAPIHGPVLPLLTLKSPEDLQSFVLGCDTDLGAPYCLTEATAVQLIFRRTSRQAERAPSTWIWVPKARGGCGDRSVVNYRWDERRKG